MFSFSNLRHHYRVGRFTILLPPGIRIKRVEVPKPSLKINSVQMKNKEVGLTSVIGKPVIIVTPNSKPKTKHKCNEVVFQVKTTSYICILCHETFNTFDDLNTHMKDRRPCKIQQIDCPVCHKSFTNNTKLKNHMTCHEEKPKYPCYKCGKVLPNTIALHAHLTSMHTKYFDALPESGFVCRICVKKFANKVQITRHINCHIHMTTKLCDICGKSFTSASALEAHGVVHQVIKPFYCRECGKAFKNGICLSLHQLTHQGLKDYMCDVCGKSFRKRFTLNDHLKVHRRYLQHGCKICGKRYVTKALLNTHMQTHLGNLFDGEEESEYQLHIVNE